MVKKGLLVFCDLPTNQHSILQLTDILLKIFGPHRSSAIWSRLHSKVRKLLKDSCIFKKNILSSLRVLNFWTWCSHRVVDKRGADLSVSRKMFALVRQDIRKEDKDTKILTTLNSFSKSVWLVTRNTHLNMWT